MPSPRRYLAALVRPDRALGGDWEPNLNVLVGAVLLLCLVNAAGVFLVADDVGAAVEGTYSEPNPDYPGEAFCDGDVDHPFSNESEMRERCSAPPTVQRPLEPVAEGAVSVAAFAALFTPFAAWLALGGVALVFVAGAANGHYGRALRYAGLAVLPGVLRAVARPVAVMQAAPAWSHPVTPGAIRPAAASFVATGGGVEWYLALVAVTALWQAAVLALALRTVYDPVHVQWVGAGAVAAALVAAGPLLANGVLAGSAAGALPGLLVVLVAAVFLHTPRTFIRVEKTLDLVGFRNTGDVEAADWYVALHRFGALCFLLLGYAFVGGLAYA